MAALNTPEAIEECDGKITFYKHSSGQFITGLPEYDDNPLAQAYLEATGRTPEPAEGEE